MATQRTETSPAATLILVAVIALILTAALGRAGFLIGAAVFVAAACCMRSLFPAPKTSAPDRIRRLSTAGRLAVVGEARYQQALREIACVGEMATAVLVPDPHRKYTVRVDILWRGGLTTTIGHLLKDDARRLRPTLLELARRGEAGSCPARIVGGRKRFYCVHLHVGDPQVLLFDHEGLGDALTLPADHLVSVTSDHPRLLHDISAGKSVHVIAELRDCVIPDGIHEGARTLEVLLDGERVGRLDYSLGQRYGAVVKDWQRRTGRALCEAVVINESIRLLLPR